MRLASDASSGDDWMRSLNAALGGSSSMKSSTSTDARDSQGEGDGDGNAGPSSSSPRKRTKKTVGVRRANSSHNLPPAAITATTTPTRKATAAKIYPSVQQREINSAGLVVNEAEIMLATASSQEGLKSLTSAKVQAVSQKVAKKLIPKTMEILCYDAAQARGDPYDADDMDDGSSVFSDLANKGDEVVQHLQLLRTKVEALGDLVAAMEHNVGDGVSGSPSQLWFALEKCTGMGIDLPQHAWIVLIHRQFAMLEKFMDVGTVVNFLSTTQKAFDDYYGLSLLQSEETRTRQQEILTLKYLESLSLDTSHGSALQAAIEALAAKQACFDAQVTKNQHKLPCTY